MEVIISFVINARLVGENGNGLKHFKILSFKVEI